MLKKCFIVFCFIIFVYGDENATNSASSGVNSSANALNLAANATENQNAQSAKNLSDKSANNSSDENAQISSDTNDASNENAQNSNDINDESAKNSSDTNDESDFSFDDFEAEFAAPKVNDPLSGYNKMMTRFNVALYTYVLRPVAKGYEFIMPEFARLGIKNFFSYIAMPIRFTGNVLQFKFKEAGTELKRFGVNTIFGFFGLIDAASNAGIPLYHSDFGLVLAHWGVGGGFHFVLPVLGPSNLRDTLSIPVNWYASPITYVATYDTSAWINWLSVGITSFGIINSVSFETQTLDAIYYNTPNLYPFMRDAYEKRRTEMAK